MAQHAGAAGATRLPQHNHADPPRDRHEHDVHDHDPADHERHHHDIRQDHDQDAADPGPEPLHPLGCVEHEVVVLVGAQVAATAHDPLRRLHGLAHFDLGPSLYEERVQDAGRVHEALAG